MVIDGESKNKQKNLSTTGPLHCHRLFVCMSFLIKV